MGRSKYRPTYELNEVKRIARAGKLRLGSRASRFLREHFFIANHNPTVEIWSMNWDGTVH